MSGRAATLAAALLAALAPARLGANDFATEAIGTTGSEFLLYDIGARGISMGGAYSAVTDDAYSLYWNPAGLSRVPRFSASFMYSHYVADTSYQSAAAARRVSDSSVVGLGFRYQDMGDIPRTDISGNDAGTFRPRHYVAEAGWGQTIYDLSDSDLEFSVGGAARWVHSEMLLRADGFGGDIGIQSRFYAGGAVYDVGFAAQNMGVGQNYDQIRDTLPFRARLGFALYPIRPLVVSLEGIMPVNDHPHGAVGIEWTQEMRRNVKAMLRAGFNSRSVESLGPMSSMSLGMGLAVTDFSVDYAFVPFGVLGTGEVHRVSFSYNLPAKAARRYRER